MKLQYSAFGCVMAFVALDERKKTRHRHTVSVELLVGNLVIKCRSWALCVVQAGLVMSCCLKLTLTAFLLQGEQPQNTHKVNAFETNVNIFYITHFYFFALKYDQIIRDQTFILSSRNAHVY